MRYRYIYLNLTGNNQEPVCKQTKKKVKFEAGIAVYTLIAETNITDMK